MRYCTYYEEEVTEEDCEACSEDPDDCEYLEEDKYSSVIKRKHLKVRFVS